MPNVSVKIEGLSELAKLPGFLDNAQRELLENGARKVADAIGDAAPKKSGRLAASWTGRAISSTKAVVQSRSPYAKSQARGAFIRPKRGKALRFSDGNVRGFARIPATNYDKKGLRKRNQIIQDEYVRAFDDLRS